MYMKLFAGVLNILVISTLNLTFLAVFFASPLYAANAPAAAKATTSAPVTVVTPAPATPSTAQTPTNTAAPAPSASASQAAPAGAGTVIALAIWVKGTVTAAQPDQSPRTLGRRSAVYEHDVIATAKDSTGEIAFTDGSVVSFNPESQFKIDQYNYKKGGGEADKSVMNLVKGGFRTITGAIPKENPQGYKINTPVATIGVRGTQYATVLSPVKGLLLQIEKGTIKVANGAGSIDLSDCAKGDPNCQRYGVVQSFDITPATTSKMPAELANMAPVTTIPSGFGMPGAGPGGVGPAKGTEAPGSNSNGPAKAVGNFCVGLLEEFYHNLQKFFG